MALTKIPGGLIEAGAITAASLNDDAVTTDKILDANITHAKLHTSMDLTGKTVTVATAAGSTNSTAAASTAFVQQELTTLIGGAPSTLNDLNELAAAINDDANYNSTLTTALATKAPLARPVFSATYNSGQDETLAEFRRDGGAVAAKIIYADATTDMEFGTTTAHALSLITADTRRLTIDSSGRVGIGETIPDRQLHLTGSDGPSGRIKLENTSASYYAGLVLTASAKEFHVGVGGASVAAGYANSLYIHDATAGALRATIDTSGNFGIGTTPKAYHSDYKAIDINNSASVMGYTGNNGAWLMENLYFGTDGNWKHKNSDFSAMVEMYDGVFNVYNTASGTADATATLQNRLKIDASGHVGIGMTPAPVGSDTVLSIYNSATPRIKLHNNTTGSASGDGGEINMSGSDFIVENREAGNIRLFNNGAERMRIISSGNVGIGTQAPTQKLDVSGNIALGYNNNGINQILKTYATVHASGNRGGELKFGIHDGGFTGINIINSAATNTTYNKQEIVFTTHEGGVSVAERMRIDSLGKVGIGTTDPYDLLHLKGGTGNSSTGAPILRFQKHSGGAVDDGHVIGGASFWVNDDGVDSGAPKERAKIAAVSQNTSSASRLEFYTAGNTTAIEKRMVIYGDGSVGVGSSASRYAFAQKLVVGDGNANDGITIQSGSTHQGNLAFNHSNTTTAHGRISYQHNTNYMGFFTNNAEKMRIDTNGDVTLGGSNASYNVLTVGRTGTGGQGAAHLKMKTPGASYMDWWDAGSGNTIRLHTHSVNLRMVDQPNGDPCIQFEAAGNIDIDGSYLSGGFDYAEYFESTDGTAIPVGTSVVLVNEKVRAATSGEQPLGVVRPGSDGTSVVGGAAHLKWDGKYLKDDYDAYLYDTVDYWTWKDVGDTNETGDEDQQCWSDRVPAGWVVPSDKTVTPMQRKRLNPDFVENLDADGNQIYVNREERDEWNCIGLLGQVPITKGQVTNSNWTKLKDRSDTVELWFIK